VYRAISSVTNRIFRDFSNRRRRVGEIPLNVNVTAADIVRDADLLPLYKRAGIDNVVMGVESLDDATVALVRKNNPLDVSRRAVALLREQGIVSLVNIIYGLEEERLTTLARTLRRLLELDADVLNTVYITPHFWTPAGRQVRAEQVTQADQALWTYRNQVVDTPHLRPWQLFLGVKLSEALFHLRPRALLRLLTGDSRFRRVMGAYLGVGLRVVLAETVEFFWQTHCEKAGSLHRIPSYPAAVEEPQSSRATTSRDRQEALVVSTP
jgi:anaerobic magnesium-protoporphyrin IX monomethyl ester cyclase